MPKNNYEAHVSYDPSIPNEIAESKINKIIKGLEEGYTFEYKNFFDETKNELIYTFNKTDIRDIFLEKVKKTKGFFAEKGKDDLEEKIKEPTKQVTSSVGFNITSSGGSSEDEGSFQHKFFLKF